MAKKTVKAKDVMSSVPLIDFDGTLNVQMIDESDGTLNKFNGTICTCDSPAIAKDLVQCLNGHRFRIGVRADESRVLYNEGSILSKKTKVRIEKFAKQWNKLATRMEKVTVSM